MIYEMNLEIHYHPKLFRENMKKGRGNYNFIFDYTNKYKKYFKNFAY